MRSTASHNFHLTLLCFLLHPSSSIASPLFRLLRQISPPPRLNNPFVLYFPPPSSLPRSLAPCPSTPFPSSPPISSVASISPLNSRPATPRYAIKPSSPFSPALSLLLSHVPLFPSLNAITHPERERESASERARKQNKRAASHPVSAPRPQTANRG